jgi:hypothetical protein
MVLFGLFLILSDATADEASTGVSYTFLQPAEVDLETRINYFESRLM